MSAIDRRRFLQTAAGLAVGAGLGSFYTARSSALELDAGKPNKGMPTRRLGKTGYEASIFSLGGMFLIMEREHRDEVHRIINRALDLGVNYIDTAASYRNGESELNIGEVLKDRRDEVFIATKTRQREAGGLIDQEFNMSSERLQTDFIDLYFLHGVNSMGDLDAVLDRDGGAITAFEHLKDQGRIGHIGVSSHCSAVLMEAMERYDFDCIFITLNPAGFAMDHPEKLRDMLAMAKDKDIGAVGMKVVGAGRLPGEGIPMKDALGYALSLPIATANIGISAMEHMEENVQLAKDFRPMDEEQLAQLEYLARA